jgi:hypothetical protein
MGHEVDFGKLSDAFAKHKTKNCANAYMLPATKAELEARAGGDWKRSIDVFSQQQAKFHQDSNSAKNASLYVDYENGRFSAPREKITETMVADIAGLNSELLALTAPKVEMLSGWQSNIEEVRRRTKWFAARLEKLRSQSPNNPEEVMSVIMQEMLDQAKATPNPPVATSE